MNRYEVLLIRFGLVYLVLAGILGVLFMIEPSTAGYFRVTHVHLAFLGFFLSLVMGVAFWMLPRPGGIRQERLSAITFLLHNAGLIIRTGAEPWFRFAGGMTAQMLLAASGFLSLAAIIVFAFAMSRRVVTAEQIQKYRRDTRIRRESAEH